LIRNGSQVFFNIDGTTLNTPETKSRIDKIGLKFDRIVWNFPDASIFNGTNYMSTRSGGPEELTQRYHQQSKESSSSVGKKTKGLLLGFFEAAKDLLKDSDESMVVVTQSMRGPFGNCDLIGIAAAAGYTLKYEFPFSKRQYPGYQFRSDSGKHAANRFDCSSAMTYAFTLRFGNDVEDERDASREPITEREELSGKDDHAQCTPSMSLRIDQRDRPNNEQIHAKSQDYMHSISIIDMDDDFNSIQKDAQLFQTNDIE